MLRLKDLDEAIARLDRAVARVTECPDDPLASYELAYCLRSFSRFPVHPALPAEVISLVLQVVSLARQLSPGDRHRLGDFRAALLDVAAAIAVQPWDCWAVVPFSDSGTVCPLHD